MNIKFIYRDYIIPRTRYNPAKKSTRKLTNHLELVEFDIGRVRIYVIFTDWALREEEKSFPLYGGMMKKRTDAGFLRSLLRYFPNQNNYYNIFPKISSYINISSLNIIQPSSESFIKYICSINLKGSNIFLRYQFERKINLESVEVGEILDGLLVTTRKGTPFLLPKFYWFDSFIQSFEDLSTDIKYIRGIIQEIKDGKKELSIYEARYTF